MTPSCGRRPEHVRGRPGIHSMSGRQPFGLALRHVHTNYHGPGAVYDHDEAFKDRDSVRLQDSSVTTFSYLLQLSV